MKKYTYFWFVVSSRWSMPKIMKIYSDLLSYVQSTIVLFFREHSVLTSLNLNYRLVSLTSVFGKVMAADTFDYWVLGNKLLISNQHGFLSKRSTLTNLLESISDWTISLENNFVNRVNRLAVLIDWYGKTFSCVKWGDCYSVSVRSGIRQGGISLPSVH